MRWELNYGSDSVARFGEKALFASSLLVGATSHLLFRLALTRRQFSADAWRWEICPRLLRYVILGVYWRIGSVQSSTAIFCQGLSLSVSNTASAWYLVLLLFRMLRAIPAMMGREHVRLGDGAELDCFTGMRYAQKGLGIALLQCACVVRIKIDIPSHLHEHAQCRCRCRLERRVALAVGHSRKWFCTSSGSAPLAHKRLHLYFLLVQRVQHFHIIPDNYIISISLYHYIDIIICYYHIIGSHRHIMSSYHGNSGGAYKSIKPEGAKANWRTFDENIPH